MTLTATKTKAEQALFRSFEAVIGRLPGGAAVRQARKAAIGAFAALGLPHRRIEAWKYTDLRSILREALPPAVGGAPGGGAEEATEVSGEAIDKALEGLASLAADRLVFVNGSYRADLSAAALQKGLTFTPLASALAGASNGARASLGPGLRPGGEFGQETGHEAIIALNTAFMSDGAVIDIAEGAKLDKPLILVFVRAGRMGRLVTTRNLISINAAARATVIEAFVTLEAAAPAQGNALSEVSLGDGAHLDHLKLTLAGDAASHLATWRVALGGRANYRAFQLTAATALARNTLFLTFAGEHAKFDLSGGCLGRETEHIDTTLVVDHALPSGESRELFKGVLADRARAVFQGKVIVRPGSQKTDGKQMAQALMLSRGAEFDCKPELEIHADDVICGHGAASSELDPDMVFYLRSRGIELSEARALLMESFIGEAIDKLGSEPLRLAIWQSAAGRLAALARRPDRAEDRR